MPDIIVRVGSLRITDLGGLLTCTTYVIAGTRMISAFVVTYGYLAVFLGTMLEGETFLLAGGFAAHRGLLYWPLVVAVAFVGASIGDQAVFLLGRWRGPALIARYPTLARRAPRVHALIERHHVPFILILRFLYGLRTVGPVIIGTSHLPYLRFAVLDMIGAAIWAPLIAGAGYFFDMALTNMLGDLKDVEAGILVGIVALALLIRLWHSSRRRRRP